MAGDRCLLMLSLCECRFACTHGYLNDGDDDDGV